LGVVKHFGLFLSQEGLLGPIDVVDKLEFDQPLEQVSGQTYELSANIQTALIVRL
jgi:hypothetical protein